jgi:hypothetical protein
MRGGLTTTALRDLIERLPRADEEFARDVEEARRSLAPPGNRWRAS